MNKIINKGFLLACAKFQVSSLKFQVELACAKRNVSGLFRFAPSVRPEVSGLESGFKLSWLAPKEMFQVYSALLHLFVPKFRDSSQVSG